MNHPFREGARLLDLAPTILKTAWEQGQPEMEGEPLLS